MLARLGRHRRWHLHCPRPRHLAHRPLRLPRRARHPRLQPMPRRLQPVPLQPASARESVARSASSALVRPGRTSGRLTPTVASSMSSTRLRGDCGFAPAHAARSKPTARRGSVATPAEREQSRCEERFSKGGLESRWNRERVPTFHSGGHSHPISPPVAHCLNLLVASLKASAVKIELLHRAAAIQLFLAPLWRTQASSRFGVREGPRYQRARRSG